MLELLLIQIKGESKILQKNAHPNPIDFLEPRIPTPKDKPIQKINPIAINFLIII
jgi:hypothetical protein